MLQVTLTPTDPPSGVSASEREPQLDSQEGKVMFFFLFHVPFVDEICI